MASTNNTAMLPTYSTVQVSREDTELGDVGIYVCQTGTQKPGNRRQYLHLREIQLMKLQHTICKAAVIVSTLAAAPLSSYAQTTVVMPPIPPEVMQQLQQGTVKSINMTQRADGSPPEVTVDGNLSQEQKDQLIKQIGPMLEGSVKSSAKPDEKAMGKTITVLDSVRVTQEALHDFTQKLQAGKVRIRNGGVRTVHGKTPETAKYGAGDDDTVIFIQSESVDTSAKTN